MNQEEEEPKGHWMQRISFLLSLAIFSWILATFFISLGGDNLLSAGNVALIPITGTIVSEESTDLFGSGGVASSTIVDYIQKADANPNIKAILFEIDSGGGSAVASDEIATAIHKVNKTTVAWIRETGASGAYWIASATNHIVANRMSITGSIGVIASYLEFAGLLAHYNVTYERLTAGKYKDIGSPYIDMTPEEKNLFQEQLDIIHGYFIDEVAKNRNLTRNQTEDLATGMFYIGSQALKYHLIDELGGKEEAVKYIESKLNITAEIAEYKPRTTFLDIIKNVFSEQSYTLGKGIGDAFATKTQEKSTLSITT